MITISVILGVLALVVFLFLQQASFGKAPSGLRLERIKKSPQYIDGAFQNQSETPTFTGGGTFFGVMADFLFATHERKTPDYTLPSVKRDLKLQPALKPEITWFGHSSYLIQVNGLNILVDPVFSGRTSPVSYAGTKAFDGADVYKVEDMPRIDVLLITHDHYDHLDYETIKKLKDKVGVFVTSLGVGAHLEYWGVPADQIKELDWWESTAINADTEFTAAPARHFSGRGIIRNKTLWSSFIFRTKGYSIYLGGDSGYDKHFAKIGDTYGPFDLAILEDGQYNAFWANIHMMPEETAKAAVDLKAKVLLPVHWGKFSLATHAWDESINRVIKEAEVLNIKVITPKIGEQVVLDSIMPTSKWWIK
ncbi:MBL fold metallo-hydrolase [Pedobacter metabolipauper]|uniref:L-ascorbate metabolism protein UlaG (Beta-lactamase superfamily) n=1 Tax=Pedobacter metabolipauper TaxID=425513 RepID=A0A4R6SYN2_9SPHI|nr:MBL fold metallo-hydrolase [Pedobacter metabolipauper]TDQ11177.1 L-ascorbate metabolism protein UlaG (beta-lactamase superfamily) [Pedobacter metabolipauper]